MRAFIISFFVVIFISAISFQATYAQQKDIVLTGMVTDHQGEPLPGATGSYWKYSIWYGD